MRVPLKKAAGSCYSLTTQLATDRRGIHGNADCEECRKPSVLERKQVKISEKYCKKLSFGVGKDRETCPCRNNTVNNEPDSFVNAWNISDIQHFYYVFQFAAFGLTTYLPTDREKPRDSGFCDPESLLYISQLAFPTAASPFQRRSPLSSGGSSPPV